MMTAGWVGDPASPVSRRTTSSKIIQRFSTKIGIAWQDAVRILPLHLYPSLTNDTNVLPANLSKEVPWQASDMLVVEKEAGT